MSQTVEELVDQIQKLPEGEKQEVIDRLLVEFDENPVELGKEWNTRIRQRIVELEQGDVEAVPWERVKANIQASLKRK